MKAALFDLQMSNETINEDIQLIKKYVAHNTKDQPKCSTQNNPSVVEQGPLNNSSLNNDTNIVGLGFDINEFLDVNDSDEDNARGTLHAAPNTTSLSQPPLPSIWSEPTYATAKVKEPQKIIQSSDYNRKAREKVVI